MSELVFEIYLVERQTNLIVGVFKGILTQRGMLLLKDGNRWGKSLFVTVTGGHVTSNFVTQFSGCNTLAICPMLKAPIVSPESSYIALMCSNFAPSLIWAKFEHIRAM